MLSLQNTVLEMIARGDPLQVTMEKLCLEIEKRLPGVLCSVIGVSRDRLLEPVAGPSISRELCDLVKGMPIGPMVGSCGTAAYFKRDVAVTDIANDPRWGPFRDIALRDGLAACWSSPISGADGRILGAFAFYYPDCRTPTEEERQIVQVCVHLSAIAFERQERVLEREFRAYNDELTGLGNRAAFNNTIVRMTCSQPGSWGILAIDLDNLKAVNDTYGHHAGDDLIKTAADRIAKAVAPDIVFRIGGDEFIAFLQAPDALQDIETVASRVLAELSQPADCGNFRIDPKASIGGAVVGHGDDLPETVREHADHALYVAKETGKHQFVRYWHGLSSPISQRIRIARKIEAALHDDRVDAWYQPIIDLESGRLAGLEALCRLVGNDAQPESAGLGELISSDSQAISELTFRMADLTANDLARWPTSNETLPFVALNVFVADLRSEHFVRHISQTFERYGIALDRLVLDVNELIQKGLREPTVVYNLQLLRDRGVRIALDDFGKETASLNDLIDVPIDILKLDPTLVAHLEPNTSKFPLVAGLMRIACDLKIEVIAEGVENQDQLSRLMQLGCHFAQGHHFSPALHRDKVQQLLSSPEDWHELRPEPTLLRRV